MTIFWLSFCAQWVCVRACVVLRVNVRLLLSRTSTSACYTHALNKSNAFLPSPSSHRYEWDTLGYALGSNHTKCDRPNAPGINHANCGFDTHYPDYFPARQGCKEATAAMQAAGMRVIPYINGQLYDTEIPRWATDHANESVQKFQAQTMATTLSPHLEHFDGITSAVMCTCFCVVVWCMVSSV